MQAFAQCSGEASCTRVQAAVKAVRKTFGKLRLLKEEGHAESQATELRSPAAAKTTPESPPHFVHATPAPPLGQSMP